MVTDTVVLQIKLQIQKKYFPKSDLKDYFKTTFFGVQHFLEKRMSHRFF